MWLLKKRYELGEEDSKPKPTDDTNKVTKTNHKLQGHFTALGQ